MNTVLNISGGKFKIDVTTSAFEVFFFFFGLKTNSNEIHLKAHHIHFAFMCTKLIENGTMREEKNAIQSVYTKCTNVEGFFHFRTSLPHLPRKQN